MSGDETLPSLEVLQSFMHSNVVAERQVFERNSGRYDALVREKHGLTNRPKADALAPVPIPQAAPGQSRIQAIQDKLNELVQDIENDPVRRAAYEAQAPQLAQAIEALKRGEALPDTPRSATKAKPPVAAAKPVAPPVAATAKVPATVAGYTIQLLPEKMHDGELRTMFDQAQWVLALNDFHAAGYSDAQVTGMQQLVLEFEKEPARSTTELISRGLVKLRALGLSDEQIAIAVQQLERIEVGVAEANAKAAGEATLAMLSQQYGDSLVERVLAARGAMEDVLGKEAKDALSEVRLPDGSKLGDHPSFVAICMALAEVEENETEDEDEVERLKAKIKELEDNDWNRDEPDFLAQWAELLKDDADSDFLPEGRPGQSLRDRIQQHMRELGKLMHGNHAERNRMDLAEYRRLQPRMQLYAEAIERLDRGESLPDGSDDNE